MIPPDKAQARWNALMERPVEGNPLQMAYLHIPFCKTKCLYCGFFQNGTDMSVEDRYVDHLLMELAQDADKPRLQSAPIQSVFIGGGTPTSLSPSNIRRLLRAIRKTLPLANDYELTLEGRVHDLVEEKWMSGWKKASTASPWVSSPLTRRFVSKWAASIREKKS